MASVDILREDAGWEAISGLDGLIEGAVLAALEASGKSVQAEAEIAVVLTSDEAVRALNALWRGKDKPTNVLSFPAAQNGDVEAAMMLGDVVVARETTFAEAVAEDKRPQDHLAHLVVHGVLHLIGYDHETADDAEKMEAVERRALERLGIRDPYAGFDLQPREPGHTFTSEDRRTLRS